MSAPKTIAALLDAGLPDAGSILGLDGPPLAFAALRSLVQRTGASLRALGLGRDDRVALVLPNGPQLAACFVAVASQAIAAPLNPAYKRKEFDFYLADLRATALVVKQGARTPAVAAAKQLGLRILETVAEPDQPAAAFRLAPRHPADSAPSAARRTVPPSDSWSSESDEPAAAGDTALLLHTSGTTSRPKVVPLSHANLCASARNVAAALRLHAGDRCLNIMPLFHIHGLVAGLLAPLCAGGSIVAAPGFDALRFFSWMDQALPSWYTAVPTMHQAILLRAGRNQTAIDNARLRFIRSSSAPLPRQTHKELEATFGVPVIEAYAMTEAAHQMTSNPLPPGKRIPGTVGRAAGTEVAIMGEAADRLLPAGERGEVVIRGENVATGYENNPAANAKSFVGGWFRTGDQGVMDEQGYLTITGRLKEIINRGGEKVSPAEVDEVLLDHPAISQALTFAVPHPALGEDLAAAVVPDAQAETDADADDIRRYVATRLAAFKVPRRILLVAEIPKGATGKPQRIGLAARLGLA